MFNPLNPPAPLRATARFYKAAQQIEKVEPVVAYHCRWYAVSSALKLPRGPGEEVNKFLVFMLDILEKAQTALGDALKNAEEVKEHFKNFAQKVFKHADDVDRAGKADKITARDFMHASIFLEAYEQFEDDCEEMKKLKLYAKWKAVQILTAIKNGEVPSPGPVGFEFEADQMDEEIGDQLPQSQTQNFQQSPTQFQPPAQQQNFQQSQNHLPPPPQNFQQMPPIQNISQNTMNFGQSLPNPPSDTNFEQQRKADQQRIEFQKAEQFRLQSEDMRVRMEQQRNLDLQRAEQQQIEQLRFEQQKFELQRLEQLKIEQQRLDQLVSNSRQPQISSPQSRVPSTLPQGWTPQYDPNDFIPTDEAVMQAMQQSKYVLSALQFEDVPTAVKNLRICLGLLTGTSGTANGTGTP